MTFDATPRYRLGLGLSLALWSAAAAAGEVSVDGAWCRLSDMRAGTAFVYVTLSAPAPEGDTLVGATTPLTGTTELLAPRMVNGRESLEQTAAIPLDPHGPTVLQPQGPHIILKGIQRKLKPGDDFVMTLQFDHAGSREITVKVVRQPPGTGMPDLPKGVKLE